MLARQITKTNIATLIMLAMIVLSMSAALYALTILSNYREIADTVYKQDVTWRKITDLVSIDAEISFSEEYARLERERTIARLIELLDEFEHGQTALEELYLRNLVVNQLFFQNRKSLSIIEHSEALKASIAEVRTLFKSYQRAKLYSMEFRNIDTVQLLTNGSYPKAVRESLEIANNNAHLALKQTHYLIFTIGIILIVGLLLIRRRLILPAFMDLEKRYQQEIQFREQINRERQLVGAAFHSLEEMAVIFDAEGNCVVSNKPFQDLIESTGYSQVPHQLFEALLHNIAGNLPEHKVSTSQPLSPGVFNVLEHVEISGRLINWTSAQVANDYRIYIGRDQTEYIARKEAAYNSEHFKSLGRLVGGVAHDFNNILAGISMRAELALMTEPSAQENRKNYEGFLHSINRAKSLISYLLSYSRNQALSTAVYNAIEIQRKLQGHVKVDRNIELEFICFTRESVSLDIDFLLTAVDNLIRNAVHALGRQKGRIEISISDRTNSAGQQFLLITTEDNGPGFVEEALHRATEPFYTTQRGTERSGLGLAMVAGFVAQSNGQLEIENTTVGARVSMVFPVFCGRKPHVENTTFVRDRRYKQKKLARKPNSGSCLLVEDDSMISDLVNRFLRQHFTTVTVINSTAEAFEAITEDCDIDCAVFDWSLPDGTSEDVIRLLHLRCPDVCLVVQTARVEENLVQLCRDIPISVIQKPATLKELLIALFDKHNPAEQRRPYH